VQLPTSRREPGQRRAATSSPPRTDAAELCALLGVKEAVGVRTVGEGADKLFSLVDAARLMSGKSARNAGKDVRIVMADFSEVSECVKNLDVASEGVCREVTHQNYKYKYLKSYGKLTPNTAFGARRPE
jgi:hypothetical protein